MRAAVSLIAAGALIAAMMGDARAHDQWADGSPVPQWVKAACCGPEDVHHLRDDQVHLRSDGWHIDGVHEVVPIGKELPSPDGTYWVFYKNKEDGSQTPIYCFFSPFNGT